jgi:hypothetical protein
VGGAVVGVGAGAVVRVPPLGADGGGSLWEPTGPADGDGVSDGDGDGESLAAGVVAEEVSVGEGAVLAAVAAAAVGVGVMSAYAVPATPLSARAQSTPATTGRRAREVTGQSPCLPRYGSRTTGDARVT